MSDTGRRLFRMGRKREKEKQPFYFRLEDGSPFAFAGIWDEWRQEGVTIPTCAIITTRPNELLRSVHDRMPVILHEEDYELWLDGDQREQDALVQLLKPYPSEKMTSYPVGMMVNDPTREGAELLEPAGVS